MKSNIEASLKVPNQPSQRIGDKIRKIADDLKQEQSIQIKATSRILGAAAQISENHDKLIDEVADMIREDLEQQNPLHSVTTYTIDELKQQHKTLKKAKAYFGIKANSWMTLVDQLNNQFLFEKEENKPSSFSLEERLTNVEKDIKNIQQDIQEILSIVKQILKN